MWTKATTEKEKQSEKKTSTVENKVKTNGHREKKQQQRIKTCVKQTTSAVLLPWHLIYVYVSDFFSCFALFRMFVLIFRII